MMLTESHAAVEDKARELAATGGLPAFVYDLRSLGLHAEGVRDALAAVAGAPEIFYAAKANPDAPILETLAPYVAGFEVASGGELMHVHRVLPGARIAFGGPGKTDAELALALDLDVERIHVESPYELERLAELALARGRQVDVLLRANLATNRTSEVALAMSGPFGMDPALIESCRDILAVSPHLRLRGIHAHLASGLDADAMAAQSAEILAWARPWLAKASGGRPEFNLGGGMAVDYSDPDHRFDWAGYAHQIGRLAEPGEQLRIEPGRAISVYSGWYVTDVLDIKAAHGQWYAVLRGGTMHLRTPVTKQHNQPFTVFATDSATDSATGGAAGPQVGGQDVTLVGQLCTPKDVFARNMPVDHLQVGDIVAFEMCGAYGWNISHHDFLMHPKPAMHYID